MIPNFNDLKVKSYGYGVYSFECIGDVDIVDSTNKVSRAALCFGDTLCLIRYQNCIFAVIEQGVIPCVYQTEYARDDLEILESIGSKDKIFAERLEKIKSHF